MAELERGYILERQAEGIALAKREGKYKGRAPIAVDEEKFRRVCTRWREGKITAVQAMAEVELKPNTFYRKVKKMGL
jgi:DNA invertase Pin-like site-specific DNA recombinase